MLHTISDWQLQSNLNGRKQYRVEIAATSLWHDVFVWPPLGWLFTLLDFTVLLEDTIEETQERKLSK